MSSISYIFGLSATIIRLSHNFQLLLIYYKTMKISVLPNFEIDQKFLSNKPKIYKIIFYFMMCFLYFSNIALDESLFYINSITNLISFIAILNMYLFSINQQNKMLIQTLIVFLIYQILQKCYYKYLNDIIFFCSGCLMLQEPINQLRRGIIQNDENIFVIEELILEISISISWLLYSLGYNIICFIIITLISLFIRFCAILAFEIVKGKIGKDTKIYTFIINLFFIKVDSVEKTESNIL